MNSSTARAGSGAWTAAAAAVLATAGDFALLYVANTGSGGVTLILIGSILGIVGIPLYALGYAAAARPIRSQFPRAARIVVAGGALGAVTGAIIHAQTGRFIHRGYQEGALGGDPVQAIVESGVLLPALWLVAAGLVLVASAAYSVAVFRVSKPFLRRPALLNPIAGTILIGVVGLVAGPLSNYVVPAAPNLAHVLFFVLVAVAGRAPATA